MPHKEKKKVLHIEVIMQNPILLLDDQSFHVVINEPIPIPELVKMNDYLRARGYENMSFSAVSDLDFSGLKGIDAVLYKELSKKMRDGDNESNLLRIWKK